MDDDRLLVGHFLQRVVHTLAPVSAHLDAAEGQGLHPQGGRPVDDHAASLQPVGDIQRLVDVVREDRRLQAVGRVIGHAYRLVDRGEGHQRHHRSEDLLLEERHIHRHFGQHGRLHETAPALAARQ